MSSVPIRTTTRTRRAATWATAALVALVAAACVPTPPEEPTVGAAIEVSPSPDAVAPGTEVTVTGSGFDPTSNVGTRPPFMGQPAGVYVVFARVGDPWRPSEGASSGARQVIDQVWALPRAAHDSLDPDGSNPDIVLMESDGSFSTPLTLTEAAGSGDYAIITYAGSGAVNAGEELEVPVSFAAAT